MTSLTSFILFSMAIPLAAWIFMVWRGFTQNWLPDELKAGKIVLVEKNLLANYPCTGDSLVGRPDQVCRLPSGLHVPLENKNRDDHRVFDTDIAQLSLQGWLLRRNGMHTAPFGYVAINNRKTGKRHAIRVDLRDDAYCEGLMGRYLDLIELRTMPRKSRGRKCNTCGHRAACHV
ncbi:hypothetical protein D5039_17545 [Verminephrobacter aporrectodeae subsp. tuberculatae]|uniref:DUF83 domain-containing protein n=1 Tax=Verminephrobacter aporrectodeae subsp. tuberculatae TaxID=1110392 RepID=A0ABT3KXB0_9BURK|nr:hypothetical protein [Verminephrobacter aporrectodeae]MCW5322886.1 hypothetical protein [Verminephrobacter aporrectodeae subsp. tuberculatae]